MHKFRGALAYYILLKAMMYFILIIICRSFDLYVVVNYQKGEIECATNPLVVLVIPNKIYLIELILFQDKYFRKAQ